MNDFIILTAMLDIFLSGCNQTDKWAALLRREEMERTPRSKPRIIWYRRSASGYFKNGYKVRQSSVKTVPGT